MGFGNVDRLPEARHEYWLDLNFIGTTKIWGIVYHLQEKNE